MKEGYLSQYFAAIAAKRLSLVETNPKASNQHEFNGSKPLQKVLGTGAGESICFHTRFIWFGDERQPVTADGSATWYDSRHNQIHRAAEYRLYFTSNDAIDKASAGDQLFVARRTDNTLLIIVTAQGSTIESQLLWLFGLPAEPRSGFKMKSVGEGEDKAIGLVVRYILEELGVEIEDSQPDYLDSILQQFNGSFPSTKLFSKVTRDTLAGVNPLEEPDATLLRWMEHEENLFRRLERQIVSHRIERGFLLPDGTVDVDGFTSFSLGVQNRRKARAGLALENHLGALFKANGITYSHTAQTENRAKPDFLFPNADSYHNSYFPAHFLTMLGVKTSCKDRWRQVLSEAARIPKKHLLTLEPGISEHQTNEMQAQNLQLVLPDSIHETYHQSQRSWLMNLSDFITLVKERDDQGISFRSPHLHL